MLAPTSLKHAPYYPVTTSVAGAAIVVTVLWWTGNAPDFFFMDGSVWERRELWRALTCTLPHVNFFHLAFNLYWVWIFGTLLERVYGHLRCAGIFLLLAFCSSLGEFDFLHGGVGLSGVGYGLWGLLRVLEKRDIRFADAVDERTSRMFVGWFFLCIALTIAGIMPVANVAHGVGALAGTLLGWIITEPASRFKNIFGLTALTAFVLVGAIFFWPQLNFTEYAEQYVERAGTEAMEHGNNSRAVQLLETAVQMNHVPARTWYNLGVAYQRDGKYVEAAKAFQHAAGMPDADAAMQQAAQENPGK